MGGKGCQEVKEIKGEGQDKGEAQGVKGEI